LIYPLRGDQSLPSLAERIWKHKAVLESHATAIGEDPNELPDKDAEPVRDLMLQMIDRAVAKKRQQQRLEGDG
jgi:hypothetical protein